MNPTKEDLHAKELLEQFNNDEMRMITDYIVNGTAVSWEWYDYCRGCQCIFPFESHKVRPQYKCMQCKQFQCPSCFPVYADFSGEHYIFDEWPYHINFYCLICIKEAVDEAKDVCYLPDELWKMIYDEVFEKVEDENNIVL